MTWSSKRAYIVLCFIYMLAMLIACVRLERSKFGYQLIAIGEDTTAAEMLGVNSSAVMTKSFVESAVTTAIGRCHLYHVLPLHRAGRRVRHE